MTDEMKAERRAKRIWVTLVVTLLGIQLVIGAFAFQLATGDPSVAIVPNYHNTALNWDREHRMNTAADRRGWDIRIETSDVTDERGRRAIATHVIDQEGIAMEGLQLKGRAYHHARASDVVEFSFSPNGNQGYLTLAPVERTGLWEFEVSVSGAEEPMRVSRTIEIPEA